MARSVSCFCSENAGPAADPSTEFSEVVQECPADEEFERCFPSLPTPLLNGSDGLEPCSSKLQPMKGQALPLGQLLSILLRVLNVHELKLALELLREWARLPMAAVPVVHADEFTGLLERFVNRQREEQVTGSGGAGLAALHSYLDTDAGVEKARHLNGQASRNPSCDEQVLPTGKGQSLKKFRESLVWQVHKPKSLVEDAVIHDEKASAPQAAMGEVSCASKNELVDHKAQQITESGQSVDSLSWSGQSQDSDLLTPMAPHRSNSSGGNSNTRQNGGPDGDTQKQDSSEDDKDEKRFEVDMEFGKTMSMGSFCSDCSANSSKRKDKAGPSLRVREELEALLEKHARELGKKKRRNTKNRMSSSDTGPNDYDSVMSSASLGLESVFGSLYSDNTDGQTSSRPLVRWCMFRPDSAGRTIFETFSLFVLLHDSIILPFVLAWDLPVTGAISAGQYIALAFWLTDMMLSFCTGFYYEGEVVVDLRRVVAHYLRGWFCLDFSVNLVDCLSVLLENILKSTKHRRLIRRLRVIRLLGVVRIMRLFPLFRQMGTLSLYTNWNVACQVVKLLCIILWINHISCCTWYGIGQIPGDTKLSWLDAVVTEDMTYKDAPKMYQYFTAMHFSMTQMTPGSMQVFPVNTLERIFNVLALIFGLLFGTSLVSQISTKMIQFSLARQDYTQRMATLRQFLRENNIPQVLATRIQRQVSHRSKVDKRLTENDVVALNCLSTSLRGELRYAAFSPYIVFHPLFLTWADIASQAIRELCSLSAVELHCMSPGKVLFAAGSKADHAFLLIRGTMNYVCEVTSEAQGELPPRRSAIFKFLEGGDTHSQPDDEFRNVNSTESMSVPQSFRNGRVQGEQVTEGSWICEAALWTQWTHLGTLEALTACELLSLSVAGITKVLRGHLQVAAITHSWARAFCESSDFNTCDITQDHGAIMSMTAECYREQIGSVALEYLSKLRWVNRLKRFAYADLKAEVLDGKCSLIIDGAGRVVRTVFVTVLRLQRQDERIFIQLARLTSKEKQDKAGVSISCQLPGAKMSSGDVPLEVINRLLEKFDFHDNVELLHTSLVDEEKESLNFGIQTRYLRTIFHSRLKEKHSNCHALQVDDGLGSLNTRCSGFSNSSRSTNPDYNFFQGLEACVIQDQRGDLLCGWVTEFMFKRLSVGELEQELMNWITEWLHQFGPTRSLAVNSFSRQPS